jgi:hypothetical protein
MPRKENPSATPARSSVVIAFSHDFSHEIGGRDCQFGRAGFVEDLIGQAIQGRFFLRRGELPERDPHGMNGCLIPRKRVGQSLHRMSGKGSKAKNANILPLIVIDHFIEEFEAKLAAALATLQEAGPRPIVPVEGDDPGERRFPGSQVSRFTAAWGLVAH